MTTAVLYATICAGLYYLLARAKITEPIWSRYPSWLDYWMSCAACSGFWYGAGCGLLGYRLNLSLFDLPPQHWLAIPTAAVLGMIWTPVIAFAHTYAWEALLPPDGVIKLKSFVSSGEVYLHNDGKTWETVPLSLFQTKRGVTIFRVGRNTYWFMDGQYDGPEANFKIDDVDEDMIEAFQDALAAAALNKGRRPAESYFAEEAAAYEAETAMWPDEVDERAKTNNLRAV